MDKLMLNKSEHPIVSSLKLIGLLGLPEAKDNERFIAYGICVDNKPFLCQKLTKAQYEFSYFLTTKDAWEPYLPENWKSWVLYDVIKNVPICGSAKP